MEEKKLGFLIANLFNDYTNYMNSYLKEMDLTLSQTRVLLVLALNNGVSIDYLAEKANIGKSSVTKSVKILEKKGFLTKEIDPEDNRRKITIKFVFFRSKLNCKFLHHFPSIFHIYLYKFHVYHIFLCLNFL